MTSSNPNFIKIKSSPGKSNENGEEHKRFDINSDLGKALVTALGDPQNRQLKPSELRKTCKIFMDCGMTSERWRSMVNKVKARLGEFVQKIDEPMNSKFYSHFNRSIC